VAAATFATDAWAVGYSGDGQLPLILHWDGTAWANVQP
jgi:hypothetical protein